MPSGFNLVLLLNQTWVLSLIYSKTNLPTLVVEGKCSVYCRVPSKKSRASAAAKSLQLCPILCDPIDDSPPGSPVPGILQARTLEWVAISFSNAWSEVTQSCPTLSDPMYCSLPGSSIQGIFQARVLEWGAIRTPWKLSGKLKAGWQRWVVGCVISSRIFFWLNGGEGTGTQHHQPSGVYMFVGST